MIAGTAYDDPLIGASGSNAIMTVIQWVRAGYAPTNNLLANAAHDGTDIGAVPVNFTFTVVPPAVTLRTILRGLTLRQGIAR
jgi:hypothetical protein